MPSLTRQLEELDQATSAVGRYIDLCLVLRREKTKETLLWAGGRWDRIDQRFIDAEPESGQIIDLVESQVPFTRWFATWLADYRDGKPRETSLVLNEGGRRGGKSFGSLACQIAALVDVPRIELSSTIGWVISESYKKRDELEQWIAEHIPKPWYRHWRAPEFRYEFVHGSILRNLSAQDPEDMRQGRVDILLYNEPQQMQGSAIVNGMFGTADKGGLTILAANPPRLQRGEWVHTLREAIKNKDVDGAECFSFSPKDNPKIDQPARKRVGKLAAIIDPRSSAADDEGLWMPVGDRAYPKWSKKLVEKVPTWGRRDITAQTLERLVYVPYSFIAGADFQGRPHQAAAILRVFEGESGPIYWFCDELIVEGTELHLSDAAYERGYTPDTLLWIPDASGSFQDARHSGLTTSFEILRSQLWNVQAPTEIKRPDRSRHPKNPDVDVRLGLVYLLMEQGRLRVDPACKWLIESFRECPLGNNRFGKRRPFGKHAHITDAASYPLVFLEPKPREPLNIAPTDIEVVRFERRGSNFYAGARR